MAVNLDPPETLRPVGGIRLASTAAQIRYEDRDDLCLMELAAGSTTVAVFTRNAFRAAPVLVAQDHLARDNPGYLLINTGSANAGTGAPGIDDARRCCQAVATATGCDSASVLPFSTGVIGERVPVDNVERALPELVARLSDDGWGSAASAIMTTDTVPKALSRQITIGGRPVVITGMAKGSGMIRPDMATMLAFVATDAVIPAVLLQELLSGAVDQSFNRITVDGDTSTNDACVLIATGQSGVTVDAAGLADRAAFSAALDDVMRHLAQAIVRDAEGATKFIRIEVSAAASEEDARRIAYTVAHSPLVKTAFFAGDPNWGRVLAAVGRARVSTLDIERVDIAFDDVVIVKAGSVAPGYDEAAASKVLAREEFAVRINLNIGSAATELWTCDLSHDYVRINAEYRS